MQVSGPPRLYGPVSHSVQVGDSAVMEMVLCADPAPLTNTWQWEGGVVLPAGASLDSRSVHRVYRVSSDHLVQIQGRAGVQSRPGQVLHSQAHCGGRRGGGLEAVHSQVCVTRKVILTLTWELIEHKTITISVICVTSTVNCLGLRTIAGWTW